MKYNQNLGNELLKIGFVFKYNHTDSEINYDVYCSPHLEVTIDHTNHEVLFNILFDDEPINITSIEQLQELKSMIQSISI